MLYCLIAWAKFLFLHLFVTIFKQLGRLLMNQLTSMCESQVSFFSFFSDGAMLCLLILIFPLQFIYMEVET
jgi:hypothetical protein